MATTREWAAWAWRGFLEPINKWQVGMPVIIGLLIAYQHLTYSGESVTNPAMLVVLVIAVFVFLFPWTWVGSAAWQFYRQGFNIELPNGKKI